jgi:dihydroorotase
MQRREFLLSLGAATLSAAERYDLLIKGGEVRDPSRNLKRKADVAVRGETIAAIEPDISASSAAQVLDAKGTMVTPGLVDLHTHCYHGGTGLGIDPDPVGARSGATTWVDAGSFGADQMEGFRKFIVSPAKVRVYGYVFLYSSMRNPDVDPVKYVRSGLKRTGERAVANRDIILGVKFQVGSNMNGRYSLEFLKLARELCDNFNLPLMAHISFAPPTTDEVMALMKPGDIVTHALNGHTLGIVEKETGRIKPSVLEARQRGVLFDVGHGLGSFNFPAAKQIIDAGFLPDTISTDIYNLNVKGPVYDMPTTMAKMLHLGMTFDDVLLRSTAKPAQVVNRVPKLGTLEVGAPADLALLVLEDGEFPLVDSQRNTVTAKQRVVCRGTVCRGKVLKA